MRTFNVYVLIPLATVIYSLAAMVHILLFRDQQVFYRYARSWSKLLLRLAGVQVSVVIPDSYKHARPGQRWIYAANHASLFDIPVLLAYLPDNVRIMYKRELERIPIFGWSLPISPYIAVDRTKAREASEAINATARTVSEGASVLVFPEGTRSADGVLGTFKRGVVTLAGKSGTPILPVALLGAAHIMPARTRRVRGGNVTMILLDPIEVPEHLDREAERQLVQAVRTTISNQLTSQHDD